MGLLCLLEVAVVLVGLVEARRPPVPAPEILAPIGGEIFTVEEWHRYLTGFTSGEWAAWVSDHTGTHRYTPEEWLRRWADPSNRYEHPLEETVVYLNEWALVRLFRLATRAAAQNQHRHWRRLRSRSRSPGRGRSQ